MKNLKKEWRAKEKMIPPAQKAVLQEYRQQYKDSDTIAEKAFFANGINSLEESYGLEKTHFPVVKRYSKRTKRGTNKTRKRPGFTLITEEIQEMIDYIVSHTKTRVQAKELIGYTGGKRFGTIPNIYIKQEFVPILKANCEAIKSGELDPLKEGPEDTHSEYKEVRKLQEKIVEQFESTAQAARYCGIPQATFRGNMKTTRINNGNAEKVKKAANNLGIL